MKTLETERATQTLIAAAQTIKTWTPAYAELAADVLAGVAATQAQAASLKTEQMLRLALDRVDASKGAPLEP